MAVIDVACSNIELIGSIVSADGDTVDEIMISTAILSKTLRIAANVDRIDG
jgi:hypothetical protein